MTTARLKRKQYCAGFVAVAALAAGAGAALLVAAAVPIGTANASEPVVIDWHSGIAISGYDPVAFFTDGKPTAGSADFELRYAGVIWRFANLGNRAAFAARPDVYLPRYGGYDPLGVARGVAVAGNPNMWLILEQRLFLFYDSARREDFAAHWQRVIAAADRKWPQVQRTLMP